MATLYGTTSDGTLIPIQADTEGRLVAQGKEGPKGDKGDPGEPGSDSQVPGPKGDKGDPGDPGPKGDTGDQGPKGDKGDTGDQGEQGLKGDKGDTGADSQVPGPAGPKGDKGDPGEAEWPPDPYEGSYLIWMDGAPVWSTIEPPVELPGNIAGPIVKVQDNSILTIAKNFDPDFFFDGQYVFASDEFGNWLSTNPEWDQSQNWGDNCSVTNTGDSCGSLSYDNTTLFDGSEDTCMESCPNWNQLPTSKKNTREALFTEGIGRPGIDNVEVLCRMVSDGSGAGWAFAAGFNNSSVWDGGGNFGKGWYSLPDSMLPLTRIWCQATGMTLPVTPRFFAYAIRVNGKMLVSGPVADGIIANYFGDTLLVNRTTGTWEVGQYVSTTEIKIAPWLLEQRRRAATNYRL